MHQHSKETAERSTEHSLARSWYLYLLESPKSRKYEVIQTAKPMAPVFCHKSRTLQAKPTCTEEEMEMLQPGH